MESTSELLWNMIPCRVHGILELQRRGKQRRYSRKSLRCQALLAFVSLGVLLFIAPALSAQVPPFSTDPPAGYGCDEACPNIGTVRRNFIQVPSPTSNPCVDMPLDIFLEKIGATVKFKEERCPLWIMFWPEVAIPVGRPGCCLLEQQQRSVVQQDLRCECTDFFIICWRRDCLPEGAPRPWESVNHWVSIPCQGESSPLPCEGSSP